MLLSALLLLTACATTPEAPPSTDSLEPPNAPETPAPPQAPAADGPGPASAAPYLQGEWASRGFPDDVKISQKTLVLTWADGRSQTIPWEDIAQVDLISTPNYTSRVAGVRRADGAQFPLAQLQADGPDALTEAGNFDDAIQALAKEMRAEVHRVGMAPPPEIPRQPRPEGLKKAPIPTDP